MSLRKTSTYDGGCFLTCLTWVVIAFLITISILSIITLVGR